MVYMLSKSEKRIPAIVGKYYQPTSPPPPAYNSPSHFPLKVTITSFTKTGETKFQTTWLLCDKKLKCAEQN